MTKVLFLLSAVVMVVAGFFSYQNRTTFIATRQEKAQTHKEIQKQLNSLRTAANEVVAVKTSISETNTEISNEQERLNQAQIRRRNAQAEAERAQEDLENAQKKIADYKKQLEDLPPGVSVETINEDINTMKKATVDAEAQVAKIQEQVTAKEADLKRVQDQLDGIVERIESRKKSFDRNSLSTRVVAVNNEWGFVVVEGGRNRGITPDTKLLVARGNQTVGRLKILAIEETKTIANIDQTSMRTGLSIAPGDRVILEQLYQ